MRWEDERYVRLYTRDTTTWKLLPWQSKCLMTMLLRKVDRAGIADIGEDAIDGISALTDIPREVVEAGFPPLLKRGVFSLNETTLLMSNFIEAQESSASDAMRQREHRARSRDRAKAGLRGYERTGPAVYFIQSENGGPIKIGFAADVGARLAGLQTGQPDQLVLLGTMPGSAAEERSVHDRYGHLRLRGEWFSPADELMDFVRGLSASNDSPANTPILSRNVTRNETSPVTRVTSPVTPSCAVPSLAVPKEKKYPEVPEFNSSGLHPQSPTVGVVGNSKPDGHSLPAQPDDDVSPSAHPATLQATLVAPEAAKRSTGHPGATGEPSLFGSEPSTPKPASAVRQVHEHYVSVWRSHHPHAGRPPVLDGKRERVIRDRLKDYSVDELKLACEGIFLTPHNMGENDRGKKYLDIELVCRDAKHVEDFMLTAAEKAPKPAKPIVAAMPVVAPVGDLEASKEALANFDEIYSKMVYNSTPSYLRDAQAALTSADIRLSPPKPSDDIGGRRT